MKIYIAFIASLLFAVNTLQAQHTENQSTGQPQEGHQGWYRQEIAAVGNSGAIFFINRDTGWVTFGDGLFYTTDGGGLWTLISPPPTYLYYFKDANNGWGQNDTALIRTYDGGKHWMAVHAPILGDMRIFGMD